MRADSAMPVSSTISRHGATPAKPWRAAAATACGSFHCCRTVARFRERSRGIAFLVCGSRIAAEKIEIGALVDLGHPLDIEPRIAARGLVRRLPGGAALGEFCFVHLKIEP